MPKSLKFCTPSMYADDTEIYASAKDGNELVTNINSDLENVRKWMFQNKLQMYPTKTKHMYIGSSFNIKNKIAEYVRLGILRPETQLYKIYLHV